MTSIGNRLERSNEERWALYRGMGNSLIDVEESRLSMESRAQMRST